MRLEQLFATRSQTLSFEFFPPKNERGWFTLEDTIEQLMPLGPDFVSVTYGAGGGTRARTREIVEHIQAKGGMTAMAHLTCVNASVAELRQLLDEYHGAGIENLLALRGDPPKGQAQFTTSEGGLTHAGELIDLISADQRFSIVCAAFPEGHPELASRTANWDHLLEKFQRGACAAITQCFFAVTPYRELCAYVESRRGPTRIIPGILPVTDYHGLVRFCTRCGASVPPELRALLEPLSADPVAVRAAGIRYTIALCRNLLRGGAPGLHLYALNRSTASAEIVTALRQSGDLA